MKKYKNILFTISILILVKIEADRIEDTLYNLLLEEYEKDVRPTIHHSKNTNVTFGFLLNQIVDVDEKNQVLTTRSWLNVDWMDRRLVWNQTEWDGISTMYFPHKKLWKPDVILINNAYSEYQEALMSTDIAVGSDGNITWLFSAIFKSSCQIRVRYYPFDDQLCHLRFACWSHHLSEIDMQLLTEKGDLSNYVNNSEFYLLSMSAKRLIRQFPCCADLPWPVISIDIKLRRRPLFYVFNHILPCVLISSMAILGFYVPPDTGEKVTMCITTMLSMGVYLKTITEIIPPTSEAVPLIGVYYVMSLFIVCLATCFNVYTLNLHRKGAANQQGHVTPFVRRWVLGFMASMLRVTIHMPDSLELLGADELCDDNKVSNQTPRKWSDHPSGDGSTLNALAQNMGKVWQMHLIEPQLQQTAEEHHRRMSTAGVIGRKSQRQQKNRNQPPPLFNIMRADIEQGFRKLIRQVNRTLDKNEMRQVVQDERQRILIEWQQLAVVFDRLLLWLFGLATALTTFLILVEPILFEDQLAEIQNTAF